MDVKSLSPSPCCQNKSKGNRRKGMLNIYYVTGTVLSIKNKMIWDI